VKYTQAILILLSLPMFFTSCASDAKQVSQDDLIGRWNMVSAVRNGDETNTLDKSFFVFTKDYFSHNLNGDSLAMKYKYVDNEIIIEDELLENLDIIDLHRDTLVAKTKIGSFKFEFTMKKNEVE